MTATSAPVVGVLAVQGGFEAHSRTLHELSVEVAEVRLPGDLQRVDALVVPGGESTTITKGLDDYGLRQPIKDFAAAGGPIFGTCAGLIMLSKGYLGLLDLSVERNAYGRQLASFEADIEITALKERKFRAVFIRAPRIEKLAEEVEVLAKRQDDPVLVRQRNLLAASFHPELTEDSRVHELFLTMLHKSRQSTI